MKTERIWTHISFSERWKNCDTSILDEIAPSWLERRKVLIGNSSEYEDFLTRLKRKHAIETGVIERMYDLEKGVTETLIKEGFVASLINHGDTNIEKAKLLDHLQDHLEAVNFVFDVVKENRPLTKGFMLELHQLVTRHQDTAEGRDQFGNKTAIPLIKGKFKERENNPTRPDGVLVQYCPPDHVDSEIDELFSIYEELVDDEIHPLIIASWFHHAFTTIHPFQDGNGRVIRLMASLILIKSNYFPITVTREEAKEKYIAALEKADNHEPEALVKYFGEIQRRNIEEVLNIREVSSTSLNEVTNIFKKKLKVHNQEFRRNHERELSKKRTSIFEFCYEFLNNYKETLEKEFGESLTIYIGSGQASDQTRQHYYYHQIVSYATQHNYFFNRHLPKAYFIFGIDLLGGRKYELGISIHHYGYDDSTIAIGAFLEYKGAAAQDEDNTILPLKIKPYIISVVDDAAPKKKNINQYLESILVATIAQIASEL